MNGVYSGSVLLLLLSSFFYASFMNVSLRQISIYIWYGFDRVCKFGPVGASRAAVLMGNGLYRGFLKLRDT